MMEQADISGYRWPDAELNDSHDYILPVLFQILQSLPKKRVFDLGCGNGSVAAKLAADGWDVTGVDPSSEGIARAKVKFPSLNVHIASAYDNLAEVFGTFPCVISLEVVEHLYDPRRYARTLFSLLDPGGIAIVSTPFHGYWKNLALALSGHLDNHFTALWDHGHIKFWSVKTLTALLGEAGFGSHIDYRFAGRIPIFAKSMIAIARKPENRTE